jgi:hypothetical protein
MKTRSHTPGFHDLAWNRTPADPLPRNPPAAYVRARSIPPRLPGHARFLQRRLVHRHPEARAVGHLQHAVLLDRLLFWIWACPSIGAGFACAGVGSGSRRLASLRRLPPMACSAPSPRQAQALAFRFAPWAGRCTARSRAGAPRYRPPGARSWKLVPEPSSRLASGSAADRSPPPRDPDGSAQAG